jgi:hypothetical protein
MASKAITDIKLKNKENISESWTCVSLTAGEQAPNWTIEDDMAECASMRFINSQWRNWKIKLCTTKKQLSVETWYFSQEVREGSTPYRKTGAKSEFYQSTESPCQCDYKDIVTCYCEVSLATWRRCPVT